MVSTIKSVLVTESGPKGLPPGRAFEVEVLDLLRGSGFRADLNSGAAKPRQTDIAAEGHGMSLLIEVKDRKRAIDVGDIDSLRVRLGRTASDFIGIIFTTGEITRGAIKAIESDRTRETIVFRKAEIELLRASKARLLNLITKKRDELRLKGHAWFRVGADGEYLDVVLPKSTIEYRCESSPIEYFCSKTDFVHAAFALDIPDTGWGASGGEGVRLSLTLSLSTLEELRDLFGYLHHSFGLSSNGAFSIHQSGACWHGSGAPNLIKAAGEIWQRYRVSSMKRVHHSEDLIYFDQLGNGWISLYSRQRVPEGDRIGGHSFLYDTSVCIQLPGVPVDAAPYVNLCRYTGNELADFRIVHERATHVGRLKRPIELQVVGTVIQTYDNREGDRRIVGLVARNPFFGKRRLPRELELDGSPLHDLLQMELMLCDIKDHIEEGDQVDKYLLEGVETTDAGRTQIIRPFGTWNKLVKRVRDGRPVEEFDQELIFSQLKGGREKKKSARGRRRGRLRSRHS